MKPQKTLGQVAYEAYYRHSKGKSLVSGGALPTWEGQHDNIKKAWESAGTAVGEFIFMKEDK